MRSALPDVPASELSAIVRAVRARPWRDRHLRSAAVAFAAILVIFLHGATVAAWSPSQARFGAEQENQMLSLRQIAVVSSLAVSSSALAQNAVQWRVQDGGNGHWYRRSAAPGSWIGARDAAASVGGHLVTVTTEAEMLWLRTNIQLPNAWAGAWQDHQFADYAEPSGGWRWTTGEPFVHLRSIQLDDCPGPVPGCTCGTGAQDALLFHPCCGVVLTDHQDGSQGDCNFAGDQPSAAIIEWSADCNGDGLVDFGQIRDGTLADSNSNNIPDCCESTQGCNPCPADVDGSGAVNGVDLAAILNVWGTSGGKYPSADVNHDGIVNGADLSEVLNGWGPCP